ncbi:MAG TPA: uracil-DNA glycosylase [Acidimicrobiales bacterium]|nr:uracil-DNA glycosylase [Acidimicrobiales bacterium]
MPTLAEIEAAATACTACPLAATRTTVVFSRGRPSAGLMFVGEAPGRDEDLEGAPFVGRSGKLLDRLVEEEMGLPRDDYYVANVLKCRPPGNRDPRPGEIEACAHFLDDQISLVAPKVIVTLGNFATRYLLGTAEGITRLRGRSHRFRDGIVVVPTFHPSAALRSGGAVVADMRADLVRAKRALSS